MGKRYITSLRLESLPQKEELCRMRKRTCYNGVYPYQIFPQKQLFELEFAPITIFYGGNGSGKTTLLNVIAEKAKLMRHSAFSGGAFFPYYVDSCELFADEIPPNSQILTSDDVFDFLLNIRYLNDGIDVRRVELLEDYMDRKYHANRFRSLDDYDNWKEGYDAKSKSQSQYVRDRLMRNVDMYSNGESAMRYFTERITENALYLLDEPENSLSPRLQLELREYISASAKAFGCQFVFSTHSPLLLSMEDAVIYDLDATPVTVRRWTELENVRLYFDFFERHREELLREE